MNTHLSLVPTALCKRAAVTEESTPPETAQRTSPSSLESWLTELLRKLCMLHSFFALHTPKTKLERTACPISVCVTSGWNCTPNCLPPLNSTAAYGRLSLAANTMVVPGSFVGESV